MTSRLHDNNACLLFQERGITLVEVLVTATVLAVLVLSTYIGIMYAERQVELNHQYRAATCLAAGELERQYYYNRYNFDQTEMKLLPYNNNTIELTRLSDDEPLLASMSVLVSDKLEVYGDQQYKYKEVKAVVEWNFPNSRNSHRIQLQEDHYPR